MLNKILIPTDLSETSNSVFPYAVTLAQAFHSKLYLLHVMEPESINEPERLEDFPRISNFFSVDRTAPDLPELKSSVSVAKMYRYDRNIGEAVVKAAKSKQVDLICMASRGNGMSLTWWSAGHTVEQVLKHAPCSVMCMRGRDLSEKDWQRPRFKHILLLVDLGPHGADPLVDILPWVEKFNSMLHIFPLVRGDLKATSEETTLHRVTKLDASRTNVLLFSNPDKRTRNLLSFVKTTPIDLVAMSLRTRTTFSNRLISDILVRLLEVTESPILLLR